MAFHDVRFPLRISQGAVGGPEYRTAVVALNTGYEQRNAAWLHPRHRYNIAYGIRNQQDLRDVLAFFHARCGRAYGFRFRDWADYSVHDTPCQQLSPTTFQLVQAYTSGLTTYVRPVTKPIHDEVIEGEAKVVTVAVQGEPAMTGWAVDRSTGVITFSSPPSGTVTASCSFDVPVRFNTDYLPVTLHLADVGTIPDIKLVEIRS